MKLLEGELLKNKDKNFTCAKVKCNIESNILPHYKNNKIDLEVANSFEIIEQNIIQVTY